MLSSRRPFVLTCVVLILGVTLGAQDVAYGQGRDTTFPLTITPRVDDGAPNVRRPPEVTGSFLPLHLPEAISAAQRDRYADVLNLSKAQRAHFDRLHERYLDDERALRERDLPLLWERSNEAASWAGPEAIEAHEHFQQERHRYERAMRTLEDLLFVQLFDILADDQLDHAHRVRAMRERERTREIVAFFPSSRIDLSQMIFDLVVEEVIEPLDHEIDEVLRAYESTLTQLRQAHARRFWELTRRGPAILAAGDGARYLRQLRTLHRYERRMTDLNLLYAEMIAMLMDDAGGDRVFSAFREAAFWGIFPDPHDIEALLSIAAEEAPEELQEGITSIVDAYHMRWDTISKQMIDVQLSEERRIQRTSPVRGEFEEDYHGRLTELQQQRAENAERTIAAITGLFESEVPPRFANAIAHYRQRVEADPGDLQQGFVFRPGAVVVEAP